MDIAVLLLSMCFFFAIGMPIAYALALSSLVGALWIDLPVGAVMQQFASGVGKVSMLTIPFFVLAGAIMAEGGMAKRLVDFAAVVVGFTRMRGGLSQVNILATTIMSGISGSSVADTSAIGSVMIPQMAAKGYPRVFATNVTISASLQAIIIPPSHNSVIYSLATGGVVSITSLFLAGVIPGLLLGFSLMLLCLFYAYRDKHPKGEPVPIRQAVRMLGEAVWGIVTLVIVLGGILTGVFTPIEAGAVACVWAFFVTMFIYRDYKWSELPLLAYRTLQTVAMVLTLVATASCFGYIAALMQMPAKMTEFFVAISSNKYVLLMWLNIMLLVLGRAFAAAKTPIGPRAAFAEIAGVRMLADQIDQPCPAEVMRELPGRGLVEPHQRRMQLEILGHAEIERRLQRLDGLVAAIRIAGIIRLAHAADDVADAAPVRQRRRAGEKHQIAAGHKGVGQAVLAHCNGDIACQRGIGNFGQRRDFERVVLAEFCCPFRPQCFD